MITEDYVSFEIAKLLKEKGFDESIIEFYVENEDTIKYAHNEDGFRLSELNGDFYYPHITHQMAMKYLREVHKVVISINAHTANHWDGCIDTFEIDILKNASRMIVPNEIAIHNTYEEAVEAALKYSLENLI